MDRLLGVRSLFLDLLPSYSGLDKKDIILVVDSPRHKIYETKTYNPNDRDSFFEEMRYYVMKEAKREDIKVIDTGPLFLNAYMKNGRKFEFPTDGHWSGYGHGIIFEELKNHF